VSNYRNLEVFWDAHRLVLDVYVVCRGFPGYERWGLASQMRRSASSIPSNIAEGCGRSTTADLARFVDVAVGSLHELDYQLMLARDLDYLPHDTFTEMNARLASVGRQLNGLRRSLRNRPSSATSHRSPAT
jgi:four helix bundle protein